jgi:hypothetical protein
VSDSLSLPTVISLVCSQSEYPDALATLAAKGDLKGILARSKQAEFQVDEPAPDVRCPQLLSLSPAVFTDFVC